MAAGPIAGLGGTKKSPAGGRGLEEGWVKQSNDHCQSCAFVRVLDAINTQHRKIHAGFCKHLLADSRIQTDAHVQCLW